MTNVAEPRHCNRRKGSVVRLGGARPRLSPGNLASSIRRNDLRTRRAANLKVPVPAARPTVDPPAFTRRRVAALIVSGFGVSGFVREVDNRGSVCARSCRRPRRRAIGWRRRGLRVAPRVLLRVALLMRLVVGELVHLVGGVRTRDARLVRHHEIFGDAKFWDGDRHACTRREVTSVTTNSHSGKDSTSRSAKIAWAPSTR